MTRLRRSLFTSLFTTAALFATAHAAEPTFGVRIDANQKAAMEAAAIAPIHTADYGSFSYVELSASEFAKLEAAGISVDADPNAFTLVLGERSFDPLRDGVPGTRAVSPSAEADLRLVQFVGPTSDGWIEALEAKGAKVVQYIAPFAYVVWATPEQLEVDGLDAVIRWKGEFIPEFRLLDRFRPSATAATSGPAPYRLLVPNVADVNRIFSDLQAQGLRVDTPRQLNGTWTVLGVHANADQLDTLSATRGVYSVQDVPTDGGLRGEMSSQVNVNNVDGTNLALVGYDIYLAALGLNGAGVVIANVDSGVNEAHADLDGRFNPCVGTSCAGAGVSSSHGTHTAGIMGGDGTSGVRDVRGFLRGLGVAPGARFIEQLYSPTFTSPGGMLTLMQTSVRNGAHLSGNSWGPAGSPRGYDNDTLQVDIGVRDSDSALAGNQSLNYILSFMNGNGGISSQGTPDEAKNCFTVGSTKMQNSSSGSQILDINDLSANSAHGPALDGRTIPHIVAPGCNVDSSDTAGGGYGLKCGTSMASPQVSGGVAMFIQYWRSLPDYVADPSPAMIKAAFTAVARNLAGRRDADNGTLGNPFDSKQGWGRFDLEAVVDPALSVRYWDNPTVFDNTGEEWTQTVSAEDPSQPIRIMLVWTDAPGHGLGGSTPAWNNNLDLIVEDGSSTYRGNVFAGSGWSTTGGAADTRNNTEGVFIGPTAPSAYNIRVVASNINSDGVPAAGDTTDQDFAVVCYNCALEPGYTLSVAPSAQTLCAGPDAIYTVSVGQILGYTDPVTLSLTGNLAGMSATFGATEIIPAGSTTLTFSNTSAPPSGSYSFTVLATAGAVTRSAVIDLDLFNGAPVAPTLRTPDDLSTGVALRPNFTWDSQADATSYSIQVALDSEFSNIVVGAAGLTEASFTPATDLAIGTPYFWRVTASNPCGVGTPADAFTFTTRVVPQILLVDDDDNGPNVQATYTGDLAALGRDFDVWNTNNSDIEPSAAQLSPYRIVIWFTGDEFGGACGPGVAGETALRTWMNDGGRLLIVSQDYHFDRQRTAFMVDLLGVSSVTNDVSQTSATGAGVFAGMGPYTLTYPFSNFSDTIIPDATAAVAFTGNAGTSAISKDGGDYRSLFFGFPLEAISNTTDRRAVLEDALLWLGAGLVTIGDMNCDGVISVGDISGFVLALTDPAGYATTYPGCDINRADTNGDGVVSVGDIAGFVSLLTGG